MISVSEARANIIAASRLLPSEQIALDAACGRYLTAAITAPMSLPSFSNSAMDGYALALGDLLAHGELPVIGASFAGDAPALLHPVSAQRIFTGAPLPTGADTVVIQEDAVLHGDTLRLVSGAAYRPGDNVRAAGSELAVGSEWFARGRQLMAADIGVLASLGLAQLSVFRKPRVALLASGDELVEPGQPLAPGQIYNSNHALLRSLLLGLGCEISHTMTVADDLAATERALQQVADSDVVLCTGGVSVGEADFVRIAIERCGRLSFWKIAVKPGKPLAFGTVGNAAFFGLPGNPVSAYMTFMLFVWPYLQALVGAQSALVPVPAIADFDWPRPGKREEYLRVTRQLHDGQWRVQLLPNQSSGALSSVALADGFVQVPVGASWLRGERVGFIPRPF